MWFLDCGPEDRSSPHSRKDGDHNPDIASQIEFRCSIEANATTRKIASDLPLVHHHYQNRVLSNLR